ncbi:hypothetical protein A9Q78_09245 [Methylophaga sp. 41_12_T18]|nr:hypothetical protein A9Q78_09245 [Methylophaga sp. 41_12_T18]
MFNKISVFIKYFIGKSSELKDLEAKDALLAKVVLDIHRKRTHSVLISVPLFALKQIHAIDRENAVAATNQRVDKLERAKQELLQYQHLSQMVFTPTDLITIEVEEYKFKNPNKILKRIAKVRNMNGLTN